MDWSFLDDVTPKQPESTVEQKSGLAKITIRVDADCVLQCDGEFIDLPLHAGIMAKTQLSVGQHLLEFISIENQNIKVEKIVDFPESDKNYLVMVNELKAQLTPVMPQVQQMPPQNQFLDQLNQMARIDPLTGMGMPQMPENMPPMLSGMNNQKSLND